MRAIGRAMAFAAAVAFGAAEAAAQEATAQTVLPQLISYEAIPSVQVELDLEDATYEQREAVTEAALDTIAQGVIAAMAIDPTAVETEMTPGGYLLATNASLQSRAALTDARADRLAAGLGYVFRQWSVLVSELDDPEGDTGYAAVSFEEGVLTAELAQLFFEHAASIDEGLGGGYTAFGDEMIFLNVRDGEGAPYSGLDDPDFAAKMAEAAESFPDAMVAGFREGRAQARFVGNDWEASPEGEDFLAVIGEDDEALVEVLDALTDAHTALVEEMGAEFGWR